MSASCPVCDSPLSSSEPNPGGRDATAYSCPRCGKFMLTGSLVSTLPHLHSTDPDAGAKLSHALRRAQEQAEPELNTDTAEAVIKRPLPSPREQADLLIRWLATNASGPGEAVPVKFNTDLSIIGSKNPAGFKFVLDHLRDTGLIIENKSEVPLDGNCTLVTLSFKGWEHYEQLKKGGVVYRKAFMAMKFDDEELNSILESVFKPSAKRAGFELNKLDDIPKAGLIDDRLRVEIQSSDFIVADLTHDNLGAYWEAGYAEGLGKPVIYTCEKDRFESRSTHFDTNHHLTIKWDAAAPEAAGNNLVATIRATLPHIAILVDGDEL